CIAAEDNCKKYQKTIEQLNKNIEELNSAMIELGQENQNLQVVQNVRSNRKWEKDNEVMQCNGCSKKFSVSLRKHHCRNCGSIFCAECTAKTATVAGTKKPARVCEPCYKELNVPVRSYSLNSTNSS
ncbi:early endosome antigen 1-like, partial [Paramuricea clavata]